jgi:hypothetical protein
MVTAALSIPPSVTTAFETGGLSAMLDAMQSLPLEVVAPLFIIRVLNVIDAYLAAIQRSRPSSGDSGGPSCPECGRGLDEDIDFCPWCTARLPGAEEHEEPGPAS